MTLYNIIQLLLCIHSIVSYPFIGGINSFFSNASTCWSILSQWREHLVEFGPLSLQKCGTSARLCGVPSQLVAGRRSRRCR